MLAFDSKTAGELHGRLRGEDATKLYVALVRGDLRERFRLAAENDNESGCINDDGDGRIIESAGKLPDVMTVGEEEQNPPHHRPSSGEHNGKISVNLPVKVDGIEKEAQTDFYFLASMAAPDDNDSNADAKLPRMTKSLTLLLCHPRTGRTHQIRRHVRKAFDAPIIGDSEHGDSRVNRLTG